MHDLSYNSNAPIAWLELFHKTYDKFLCIMQLFSQYNIHPYLTETFLDAFHLYQENIEIVH